MQRDLSWGTLKATLLSELQAGLINGMVVPAPGAKLQRVPTACAVVVLPTNGVAPVAPKTFWVHANGPSGVPLTYVCIADIFQLPIIAFARDGMPPGTSSLSRPVARTRS